jgi:hypothetical protein
MSTTVERGFAGHFIGSNSCRYTRTTDIDGRWRVSTVGDYHPAMSRSREEIGYKRFFETMVFALSPEACDCGCEAQKVASWSALEAEGYQTLAEADLGHAAMVERWLHRTEVPA